VHAAKPASLRMQVCWQRLIRAVNDSRNDPLRDFSLPVNAQISDQKSEGAIIRRFDVPEIHRPMAITHFRAQIITLFRSPVAAAAYRHRTSMVDQISQTTWDYSAKADLDHEEIAVGDDAPAWAKALVRKAPAIASQSLWNRVSIGEKRYDAQAAREIIIALPNELTREQNIQLMRDYVAGELLPRGFIADWVLHNSPGNPHVHVMHTTRPLTEIGFGAKVIPRLDDEGQPLRRDGKLLYARFLGDKEDFTKLRLAWGDYVNRAYAAAGHDIKIDMRSYAARGLDILPNRHLGQALSAMKRAGYDATALEEFKEDYVARSDAFKRNPDLAVTLTSEARALFTADDLAKTIAMFVTDPAIAADVLARALASTRIVMRRAATDAAAALYATHDQINAEQEVLAHAHTLAGSKRPTPRPEILAAAIADTEAAIGNGASLSAQQKDALAYLSEPHALRSVVGLAGTGKSTLLAAANRAWTANGDVVIGASVSGIATRGLETAAGISSRTVASWLAQWDSGAHFLTPRHVFVLDEAGMIGTKDMQRIIAHVRSAGAKLVLVGDPDQLAPIAAGSPFRAILTATGNTLLSDIRRQKDAAHRAASTHFAAGETREGLSIYRRAGDVHTHELLDSAVDDLVRRYVSAHRPDRTQLALAYTNAHVERINASIRGALIAAGRLAAATHTFETPHGTRAFSAGDRLLFLETRKIEAPEGLVPIDSAWPNRVAVRLDSGRTVTINATTYNAVSHGYAATIHKSQGVTVDATHVLVTKHMDRSKAYVAFSRHRSSLSIYEPQSALSGSLEDTLSALDRHPNALDDSLLEARGIDRVSTAEQKIAVTTATGRARLAAATQALARAAVALRAAKIVRPLQRVLTNIRVVAANGGAFLRLPASAPQTAHSQMQALGGRFIASKRGGYFALPVSDANVNEIADRLRYIDVSIPRPISKQPLVSLAPPHAGMALDSDGVQLFLRCADHPALGTTLEALQPAMRFDPERTFSIRLDLFSKEEIKARLNTLAQHYEAMSLPPYDPRSGVLLPVDFGSRKADDPSLQPTLVALDRHFRGAKPADYSKSRIAKALPNDVLRQITEVMTKFYQQRAKAIDRTIARPMRR
jgi:Ti-type conjugative transfer relaxase TraA